jgi:glycosyltransferase involved in cell wall biosynthesis
MTTLRRLLIVNWRDIKNPEAGGAELHLQEVTRRLAASGVQCILYAHHYKGAPRHEQIEGVDVYRRGNRFFFNFTVWFCVRSWVRNHKPDCIIDDSNKIPFFLSWICRVPVVVRIHHLFRKVIFHETGLLTALYVYFLEWLGTMAWKSRPVITVSESTRRELQELGIQDAVIAPNGVDFNRFTRETKYLKKNCTITCIGRIKKYKRLDVAIHAVAQLKKDFPDIELIIAGSGDDLDRLKAIAVETGIAGDVTFSGFVSEEEKVCLYSEATVVVNTSLKEGWGLTVIEANACGTVVVATDVPGLRDSIRNGKTGFLVPLGDEEALKEKLSLVLKDESLRGRMEKAALAWAREHTWDRTFEITRDVLLSAVEKNA